MQVNPKQNAGAKLSAFGDLLVGDKVTVTTTAGGTAVAVTGYVRSWTTRALVLSATGPTGATGALTVVNLDNIATIVISA